MSELRFYSKKTGPMYKVSSERPEKPGTDLVTPGLVVPHVTHYTTSTPFDSYSMEANRKSQNWFCLMIIMAELDGYVEEVFKTS